MGQDSQEVSMGNPTIVGILNGPWFAVTPHREAPPPRPSVVPSVQAQEPWLPSAPGAEEGLVRDLKPPVLDLRHAMSITRDDGRPVTEVPQGSSLVLGRSFDSFVRCPDARVGEKHARLIVEKGMAFIYDEGSALGTFLDGRRIPSKTWTIVPPESHVTLGKVPGSGFTLHMGEAPSPQGAAVSAHSEAPPAPEGRLAPPLPPDAPGAGPRKTGLIDSLLEGPHPEKRALIHERLRKYPEAALRLLSRSGVKIRNKPLPLLNRLGAAGFFTFGSNDIQVTRGTLHTFFNDHPLLSKLSDWRAVYPLAAGGAVVAGGLGLAPAIPAVALAGAALLAISAYGSGDTLEHEAAHALDFNLGRSERYRETPCFPEEITRHEAPPAENAAFSLKSRDVVECYQACREGRKGHRLITQYAGTDVMEYFAESVKAFLADPSSGSEVNRDDLLRKDPAMYGVLERLFQDLARDPSLAAETEEPARGATDPSQGYAVRLAEQKGYGCGRFARDEMPHFTQTLPDSRKRVMTVEFVLPPSRYEALGMGVTDEEGRRLGPPLEDLRVGDTLVFEAKPDDPTASRPAERAVEYYGVDDNGNLLFGNSTEMDMEVFKGWYRRGYETGTATSQVRPSTPRELEAAGRRESEMQRVGLTPQDLCRPLEAAQVLLRHESPLGHDGASMWPPQVEEHVVGLKKYQLAENPSIAQAGLLDVRAELWRARLRDEVVLWHGRDRRGAEGLPSAWTEELSQALRDSGTGSADGEVLAIRVPRKDLPTYRVGSSFAIAPEELQAPARPRVLLSGQDPSQRWIFEEAGTDPRAVATAVVGG